MTCAHSETTLRVRTLSNGSFSYADQCRACGTQVGNPIRKEIAARRAGGLERIEPWDTETPEKLHREAVRANQERTSEWWRQYNEYLRSPAWRFRRAKVLKRSPICEGCGDRKATQAHHRTYDRVGHEMLFDLVAICDQCHEALHRKDDDADF